MNANRSAPVLRVVDKSVDWPGRPLVMGIVNVTPDSFSDGGRFLDPQAAIAQAQQLAADGADWLDIGGESTRPGADPVPIDEELRRVIPVIEAIAHQLSLPLSIDTYKPEVARQAVKAGATIINDVTGFREPAMRALAASTGVGCVCMHLRGMPANMLDHAHYTDLLVEVVGELQASMDVMIAAGIERERIILDPGVGFAKKLKHNVELFRRLTELHGLGRPLLIGASRKRMIGEITGRPHADRLAGSIATALVAMQKGAHILRVHDVGAVRDALAIAAAII